MRHLNSHRPSAARGFTLIELLVSIGIIVLLISILVPAINSVRKAVQVTSTRQMLSRLEGAITQYSQDFGGSFPGVFLNNQLKPFTNAAPEVNGEALSIGTSVTSSENLYLALSGGLFLDTSTTPNNFNYVADRAKNASGPGSLNPRKITPIAAYMPVASKETSLEGPNVDRGMPAGQWNATAGGFAGDTVVPEYMDKFPTPSPILYSRAIKGAPFFYSDRTTPNFDAGTQYQTAHITNTYSSASSIGQPWSPEVKHFAAATNDTSTNARPGTPATETYGTTPGMLNYLGSQNSTSLPIAPVQKDAYILISAGPDGIYGTKDDITNFR
ncbi:MAG TPA: type II secretion system protein [Tepidisphaeraceae bacterium]|jgi:prepilin-type N-terminal cleavage/methylation domain-containing protein